MENFNWEIAKIQSVFPDVSSDTILNFIKDVPEENKNLMIPLGLKYCMELNESGNELQIKEENSKYLNLIYDLFPQYSRHKILKKLEKYGSLSNRCKIVIGNCLRRTDKTFNLIYKEIRCNQRVVEQFINKCKDNKRSSTLPDSNVLLGSHDVVENDTDLENIDCSFRNINVIPPSDGNNLIDFTSPINNRAQKNDSVCRSGSLKIESNDIMPIPESSRSILKKTVSVVYTEEVPGPSGYQPKNKRQRLDHCPITSTIVSSSDTSDVIEIYSDSKMENLDAKDGVTGIFCSSPKDEFNKPQLLLTKEDNKIISSLMEIFPSSDPNYIKQQYNNAHMENINKDVIFNVVVEKMLQDESHPKRPIVEENVDQEIDMEQQLSFVKELLPDADPTYLEQKVFELSSEELKLFIANALEKKDYPTLKEHLRKQKLSAQMRQYTSEFSVENFVKAVPNPEATFSDPKRKNDYNSEDSYYIQVFFKNKFELVPVKVILNVLKANNWQPYKSVQTLRKMDANTLKSKRHKTTMTVLCKNIPLLQELAFIEKEQEILDYINKLKKEKEEARIKCKNEGRMLCCNCCFDDEIMPNDTQTCSKGCVFCKNCIIKGTEVAFGEGKLDFHCLGDCDAMFTLPTLQDVLPPLLFSKISQRKNLEEIKAAGMKDLEFCPFCDFATIPPGLPEENKIFICQNPDCLKESCRLCQQASHVPLHCDELEKDEEVKKRVFVENKMTEALLRTCWKCGLKFFKEEGCNKMTCQCGAKMCYICKKPVEDYKHFNGIGGDQTNLCPLYSDTLKINQQDVLKGANTAKAEIGVAGPSDLKYDPAADVDEHFKERAKKIPREPHIDQLLNQAIRPNIQQIEIRLQEMRRHMQGILNGDVPAPAGINIINVQRPNHQQLVNNQPANLRIPVFLRANQLNQPGINNPNQLEDRNGLLYQARRRNRLHRNQNQHHHHNNHHNGCNCGQNHHHHHPQ